MPTTTRRAAPRKRVATNRTEQSNPPTRTPQEQEALDAAIKRFADQSDALGLLDPLDAEPAIVFNPEDRQ
jgi:hypothetical protein